MDINVMKFGGTSVDRMDLVGDIVEHEVLSGRKAVAVVSAFSGETNKLLKIADAVLDGGDILKTPGAFRGLFDEVVDGTLNRASRELSGENLPPDSRESVLRSIEGYLREQIGRLEAQVAWASEHYRQHDEQRKNYIIDRIVGLGEVFSAHVLAKVFTVRSKIDRVYEDVNLGDVFDASAPPVLFKNGYEGEIDQEVLYTTLSQEIAMRVNDVLAGGSTPIVTGYAGYIPGGILNTIDRGYTDSTAAMAARGLKQTRGKNGRVKLTIMKEVDGLLSADPKLVGKGNARLRTRAHFDEAAELSDLAGMKAINPHGIWVLDGQGVDIHVKNTFNPQGQGTLISLTDDPEVTGVRFISGKKGQTMFRVSSGKMIEQKGVAADIFQVCRQQGISVDAITTSARTVAFSVDGKDARNEPLAALLSRYGRVDMKDKMAIVCCIGNQMADQKGLLSWLSGLLAANGINIEFDGGDGDRNVTFIINEPDYEKAVEVLHQATVDPDNFRRFHENLGRITAPERPNAEA